MTMLTYAPLGDRTPFTGDTVRSDFTVSWQQTLTLLDRELEMLRAVDPVLEVDVLPSAIRLDGTLRGDRRVESPGVRLRFDSEHGPLSYATDRFTAWGKQRTRYDEEHRTVVVARAMRDSWRHNVYAIAKGLEALRLVDRYGIAGHGEQYRGYLAIEATAMPSMTRDAAEQVLRAWSGWPAGQPVPPPETPLRARLVRLAKAGSHPDRHDGDRAAWESVQTALRVLGLTS